MLRGFFVASLTFHVLVLWLLGYCGRADVVDPLPPETVFQLYTESPLSPEAGRVEPKPLTSSWKVTSLYSVEQVRANSLSDSNHLLAVSQEKQLVRRRLLPNTSSGEVATKQDNEADPAVRTGDLLSVPANPPVSTIDQGALGAPRPDDLHKPIAQGMDATALTEKKPNGSSVSSLPAVDILPKRIYQPVKVYPAQAQRNNWSGEIEVMVEIKNDGKVGEVRILKSSGYNALDEEAVREAKKCRYTPALKDGKPVVYQESFTIAFNLEG